MNDISVQNIVKAFEEDKNILDGLSFEVRAGERVPPKRCIRCITTCDPQTTPYCINQALIDGFYGKYETGLFFCGVLWGKVVHLSTAVEVIDELEGVWL